MSVAQELTHADLVYRWTVDEEVVATLAPWARRSPDTLGAELDEMARHFPHWLVVASDGGRPLVCVACRIPIVPSDGACRCVRCGRTVRATGIAWSGILPALARREPVFAGRRRALAEAGFEEVRAGGYEYLLVPLVARLPDEWPNREPEIRYPPRWLEALELPLSSGAHHVIQQGRACLYAYNQWRAAPLYEVIQQRVVNHVASLLKISAGHPPAVAFNQRLEGLR